MSQTGKSVVRQMSSSKVTIVASSFSAGMMMAPCVKRREEFLGVCAGMSGGSACFESLALWQSWFRRRHDELGRERRAPSHSMRSDYSSLLRRSDYWRYNDGLPTDDEWGEMNI